MAGTPIRHRGKWRIRWRDTQGRRRSECYDDFDNAKFAIQRHELEVQEVERGLKSLRLPDKTFNQLFDYWLEKRAPRKRRGSDAVAEPALTEAPQLKTATLSDQQRQEVIAEFIRNQEVRFKKSLERRKQTFVQRLEGGQ